MPTIRPELVRLRQGKDALRLERRSAPLAEKLRQLVYAQHLYVQVAGSRRQLKPWQRPWNILSDVSECVVIGPSEIEPTRAPLSGSAQSQWVRPLLLPF